MKGKRYTTEDKIRILRDADTGKSVLDVCREHNISEVSFHRWKRQFGQMEISEARRLKDLERENGELKKMLASSIAEKPCAGGSMRKKMVSPGHRKQVAKEVVEVGMCSGRAACRFLHLSRSTYWYQDRMPTAREQQLVMRLKELSDKHSRYGYRRIAALLRREGWSVGKRHIQRLRRMHGLRVPPTKRKLVRRGVCTGLPTKADHRGHVWTWDFISDATTRGGALRMLTILDEHTRECHVLRADRALRAADVLEWLKQAIQEHGAPKYLRE
jgi:transposase-like protein